MIEIEQKFHPTKEQLQDILDGAVFIDEQHIHVKMYDKLDGFQFSLKDYWLRWRNGVWNLKYILVPEYDWETRRSHVYRELEDLEDIKKAMDLDMNLSLEEGLTKSNLEVYIDMHFTRSSYMRDGIRIDVDITEHGYAVVEFELEIAEESEEAQERARSDIRKFAERFGLDCDELVLGKFPHYVYDHMPELYALWEEHGIVPKGMKP